jgi:hypothetical protein
MARNRGKKALYEVMSKGRLKPRYGKTVEQMYPKKTDEVRPVTERKPAAESRKTVPKWWRKPRMIQFNTGRIEFSMPYQIAIAVLLFLILLVLTAYRLGQYSQPTKLQGPVRSTRPASAANQDDQVRQATVDAGQSFMPTDDTLPAGRQTESDKSAGDHVIVLAEYKSHMDLVPAQAHFDKYNINTEIVMENGRYFLQTKDKYSNPDKPGTDGYEAKKIITEIGAKYKGNAPAGYESFAPHYFSDAYGKKVKK